MSPGTPRAAVLLAASLLFVSMTLGASAQQAGPLYNNSTAAPDSGNWTEGHGDVTLENVSYYVAAAGSFLIGDHPDDGGAAPLFAGMIVGGVVVSYLGTSGAGLVAGASMGMVSIAALSQTAGLLPKWMYGVAVLFVAFVGAIIYIRGLR